MPAPELTKDEIILMREAGRRAAKVLNHVGQFVKPGVSTLELDQIAVDRTLSLDCTAAPLNYHGYPKSICTSVNSCICHGLPDSTVLVEGDIVNVDITVIYKGFHGDTSRTFLVGQVSDRAKRLVEAAEGAMMQGISAVKGGQRTGDVGFAIEKFVRKAGYFAVEEIGGHGIGRKFHDEPFVPSFGKRGKGELLLPNRCITVEPMVNETGAPIKEYPIPNSEIRYYLTGDQTLSAQFEHTVLITAEGCEILTIDE